MIERIIRLINAGTPVALIGCGGIGKTSIGLTLLDDDRIKGRFGKNRRFIRCDEVRSYAHFLDRLSKATGAGIEDAQNLTALRPFLHSTNIFVVLDNAETILDPYTPDARTLYSAIEELSQIKTISLLITTRISITPPTCQQLEVPVLSIASAREAFYNIWTNQQRTQGIDSILQELDYHPLSMVILATVATQNRWDRPRLLREWEQNRTTLLRTHHTPGLSAAVQPSLSSPMFTRLGPDANGVLYIIATLPQGVNEEELEWLFPTILNVRDIIDTFYILSLTRQNRNFVTMLAPLREYLEPLGYSHPLLSSLKNRYLNRLCDIALGVGHGHVPPQEIQWFISEEINIGFFLMLFLRANPNSVDTLRVSHAVSQISLLHLPRMTSSD